MGSAEILHMEDAWVKPVYRHDSPVDRALVLVSNRRAYVLEHVGSGLAYVDECTSFLQENGFSDFDDLPSGLWVWEGSLENTEVSYGEYDPTLVGEHRFLTKEEMDAFLDSLDGGSNLWDHRLWIENYDDLVSEG